MGEGVDMALERKRYHDCMRLWVIGLHGYKCLLCVLCEELRIEQRGQKLKPHPPSYIVSKIILIRYFR